MEVIEVSIVSITPDLIEKVAERTQRPVVDVQTYIATKNQQDDDLLRAFLFFGVGPLNKRFSSDP